jgi:C1A family cysteine protease
MQLLIKRDVPLLAKSIDSERDENCGVPLSKFNLNYVFQPRDHRDHTLKSVAPVRLEVELPEKVDLAADGWGAILDQGDLGSCVSNSVAYCIRYVRIKDKMTVYDPSRLYIYYYGRVVEGSPAYEDTGLFIRNGYKSVAKYSVCSEQNWPYVIPRFQREPSKYAQDAAKQHRTFRYLAVDQSLPELQSCLADGYPISFGMTVFASFMSASVAIDGKVPMPDVNKEQQLGGHCMTIVGYDNSTKCFKIVNSWGDAWGNNGFCYIPYDYILNNDFVSDFCTPRAFF